METTCPRDGVNRTGDSNRMRFSGDLVLASDDRLPGSAPLPTVASNGTASAWANFWFSEVEGNGFVDTGAADIFVRCPQKLTAGQQIDLLDLRFTGELGRFVLSLVYDEDEADNALRVRVFDNMGALVNEDQTSGGLQGSGWFTDELMRIGMRVDRDGSETSWIIGWSTVSLVLGTSYSYGSFPITGVTGSLRQIRFGVRFAPSGGVSFGHLVVRDVDLTPQWSWPADFGHQGEGHLNRMVRLATEESMPFVWSNPPDRAVEMRMGPQRIGTFLSLMQEAADTGGGILTEQITARGLRYRSLRDLYNQAPALILDAANNEITIPFRPVKDDQKYRNAVTAQRVNGSSATDELEDGKPRKPQAITRSLFSDSQVMPHASWWLHFLSESALRHPEISIDFALAPHLRTQWLALEEGDRVQVVNLPSQLPERTIDVILRGLVDRMEAGTWVGSANCTAAKPYTIGKWGPGYSKWDTAGSTLTSPVDATSTEITVENPGLPWTTNPASYPITLRLGGSEVVTATEVDSPTSPQTFTVIRNVNGYGRNHPSGTTVRLAEPAVIGL